VLFDSTINVWVLGAEMDVACEQCAKGEHVTLNPAHRESCLASGCLVKCEECGDITVNQHRLGAKGFVHMDRDEFAKFERYFTEKRDGHFGLKYTYDIADHAGEFYRKRRTKYEQAIAESALADLAATITQYT
jgi:RecJ-like exonuclease